MPNAGQRFTGWEDADGNHYDNRTTENLTSVSGDIVVLQAQWDRPLITSNDLPVGQVDVEYGATLGLSGAIGEATWTWTPST